MTLHTLTPTMHDALIRLARAGGKATMFRNGVDDPLPLLPDVRENTIAGLETRGCVAVQWAKESAWPRKNYVTTYQITPTGWRVFAAHLAAQPNGYFDRLFKVVMRLAWLAWAVLLETEGLGYIAPIDWFKARYGIDPNHWRFDLRWYAPLKTFVLVLRSGNLSIHRHNGDSEGRRLFHVSLLYTGMSYSKGSFNWLSESNHHPNSVLDVGTFVTRLQEAQRIADALNADMQRCGGRLDPYEAQILAEHPNAERVGGDGWPVFPPVAYGRGDTSGKSSTHWDK